MKTLSLWYGAKQPLRLDLALPQTLTALIGPSGCGKSTLLRCLNRMNDLIDGLRTEGQVLFEGNDIFAPEVDVTELRKRFGMVFQKSNPFPKSVYENVVYGLRIQGVRNKTALDRRGAGRSSRRRLGRGQGSPERERFRSPGDRCSGLHRPAIAVPEVVLMDEPASASIPSHRKTKSDLRAQRTTRRDRDHNMQGRRPGLGFKPSHAREARRVRPHREDRTNPGKSPGINNRRSASAEQRNDESPVSRGKAGARVSARESNTGP